ncbi:hypothetical protein U1Q18_003264, partial [Sarracenia purpurea var. burkii]
RVLAGSKMDKAQPIRPWGASSSMRAMKISKQKRNFELQRSSLTREGYTHSKVDDAAQAYAPSICLARHADQLGSLDQDQPVPSTADPACSSGHLPSPASHHSKDVGKLGATYMKIFGFLLFVQAGVLALQWWVLLY